MHTILLIDDDRDYREVHRELLEEEGYIVVLAENGAVALSVMQQSKPSLILSDDTMPIMTGIELLQTVKSDDQLKMIPFVLVAGRVEDGFIDAAKNLGAAVVLVKPVEVVEMLSVLDNILKH